MKKLLLALALLLVPASAWAQCNGIFGANTACGSISGGVPGQIPLSSFQTGPGGTSPQIQFNNSGAFGGLSTLNNSYLTPGAANTVKGSLNGTTTTDEPIPACATDGAHAITYTSGTGWSCTAITANAVPLFASRAAAAATNLSAFTVVKTLGYTTGGDGGGATFQKVGTANFLDTTISASTITGGSGYTAGTYLGIAFSGGTGNTCAGGVVASGGAITQVLLDQPCPGYKVGDVLTATNSTIGGGTGFSFTVTGVAGPTGSFTDTAGTHWQIVTDAESFPNVLQFGAKADWFGADGSATNNLAMFQSAMAFAYVHNAAASANVFGDVVIVPKGAYMLCSGNSGSPTFVIPQGVKLRGAGEFGGTNLVQCTAESPVDHFIQLCGALTTRGMIGCKLSDMSLTMQGTAGSGINAVWSNSGQQFPLMENVYINPLNRGCLLYQQGLGGAANAIFNNIDCEGAAGSESNRVTIASSVGSTQVKMFNWVIEASGAFSGVGVAVLGGSAIIDTLNIENISTGIAVEGGSLHSIKNLTGGSACSIMVQIVNPAISGGTLVENLDPQGCTTTVNNRGTNITGNIVAPTAY